MSEALIKKIFLLLSLLILAQEPVYTQTTNASHGPVELGAALGVIGPVGDFSSNVGSWSIQNKGGLNFDLILDLNRSGLLRLRFDYFFGQYQREIASKYSLWFRTFSLGPEVGLSHGPVLPYMNAGYEWLSFFASALYLTDAEKQQFRETTHGGSGLFFGGGGRIPLGSTKRWAIDIGLRYHYGGTATYLTEGAIQKNPDGTVAIIPTRGRMRFMILTLGFQWRPRVH